LIIKKPPTAVLNAIQILGIFFLSSCLRSRGDDPLKIAGLEAFHRAKAFADLAAVAAGDSGFLVTIEHTYEMVQGSFNAPTEKTIWRFWTPEKDTVTLREKESVTFREAAHGSVVMPTAKAIVMTLQGNRLLALLQVNEPVPAFLLSWDDIKGPAPGLGPPQISSTPSRAVPVELGEHEASMVLVDYAQDWSTRTLPSSRWLFHPSLSSLPDLPGVVMALNTSDARAVVWRSDGAQKPKTPLVFLERALNPVLKPLEVGLISFTARRRRTGRCTFTTRDIRGSMGILPFRSWMRRWRAAEKSFTLPTSPKTVPSGQYSTSPLIPTARTDLLSQPSQARNSTPSCGSTSAMTRATSSD